MSGKDLIFDGLDIITLRIFFNLIYNLRSPGPFILMGMIVEALIQSITIILFFIYQASRTLLALAI